MVPIDTPLSIGSLVFDGVDQIDFTGPFEVLSRLPNTRVHVLGLSEQPVRDVAGLRLAPDRAIADAPPLDVLHVPGGRGQERLMENAALLEWLERRAEDARVVFSVCTGALLCGAAGLLRGRRATTHWSVLHLLRFFGAEPVDARVVRDDRFLFAAGVTAGIDGALRLAAELRGVAVAEEIQLHMAYAPEPPFNSGTPATASPPVLAAARRAVRDLTARRATTARRVAARFGIDPDEVGTRAPPDP